MEYCKWLKQKESCWKPKELLSGKTHLPLLWHSRWQPGILDIEYFVLVTAAKELAMKRFGLNPKQEVIL